MLLMSPVSPVFHTVVTVSIGQNTKDRIVTSHLKELTLTQVQINILTLSCLSILFGKQDLLKGEFHIEVLNFIPKQKENRIGMQRSCFVTIVHSITLIGLTQSGNLPKKELEARIIFCVSARPTPLRP